jgi:hypothetical protein
VAATGVSVREVRTELVLEPIGVNERADTARCLERGTNADGTFGFPLLPLLSNHLELSCSLLRRCSGHAALDFEPTSDEGPTFEQIADGTFVARWVQDVGARTDGISRGRIPMCARLQISENPSRPWRAAGVAAIAVVALGGWLVGLRGVLRSKPAATHSRGHPP